MERKAARVFLDSNVILSGLISDKGAPRIILDMLSLNLPFMLGITGQYNIIEIERNLKKKIPKALPVYKEYFSKLKLQIISMPSNEEVENCRFQTSDKDVPVVISALNGRADFLVTGDKKDFMKFKEKGHSSFKIVSPSEFLDEIIPIFFK